jgi:CRP-like cAMP-binding protein
MKGSTDWSSGLLKVFTDTVSLTAHEQQEILRHWNIEFVLKRFDFLDKPGQIEDKLFYVREGTMRLYYPNDTEEICVGFAYADTLICSYPSFIRQRPSTYYIQALSNTTLVAISRTDFYRLLDAIPTFDRCWRLLQEQALIGKIERETELLTFTPEERYRRLRERSPHIFQLIPRKYIASYLRMTPETLSRIRM